ncbi:MAG: DUF5103 domain-containing protein [Bacteroides sp.]|nr:DUF5103 domain-containing protein [Bacteroides sp.]
MNKAIYVLLLTVMPAMVFAGDLTDTSTAIFDPAFRTLQVEVDGDPYAPDVIVSGDDADRIVISFDELASDRRYMRYQLIHCDRDWQPEQLVDSEFIDGFNEAPVEDYRYSRATLVQYVHYTIRIPDENMRITAPGNYLVRVYDENDPDETLLQARFGVCDCSMDARATVSSRTDIDTNLSHQQLDVTVDTKHTTVRDMFGDIYVTVSQNGRVDNTVTVNRPLRVNAGVQVYEHNRDLIFPAGNEYRRVEPISTRYPGMGVENIEYHAPVYQITLATDGARNRSGYQFDSTQHGRYLVREYNSTDSDVEADYVMVHFALEVPRMENADVFLDGDFVMRRFDPTSRMVWNHATGRYETSLLLKQGAYNYQYLTVPTGSMTGTTSPVEGDYYETVNEYEIRVYHRPPGTRYDRLVGITTATSGR